VTRNSPIQRTFLPSTSSSRYTPTATAPNVVENSYMLPQGARWTDAARKTTPVTCSSQASTVKDTAIRPYRSPFSVPPAAPGPSAMPRSLAEARVMTLGRSMVVVTPPRWTTFTVAAGAAPDTAAGSAGATSAADWTAIRLRLPKTHSARCARKASV